MPIRVPTVPTEPVPSMLRLRRRTVRNGSLALPAAILMITPLAPPVSTPAVCSWQSMVIDLVMVTVPKAPESRQLMMPLMAVLEIAPAKVLHGAVRLQG